MWGRLDDAEALVRLSELTNWKPDPDAPKCCECGRPLEQGARPTPKGRACADCWFELLGQEIERQPLGNALGARR